VSADFREMEKEQHQSVIYYFLFILFKHATKFQMCTTRKVRLLSIFFSLLFLDRTLDFINGNFFNIMSDKRISTYN
jgi:hypothetical protein